MNFQKQKPKGENATSKQENQEELIDKTNAKNINLRHRNHRLSKHFGFSFSDRSKLKEQKQNDTSQVSLFDEFLKAKHG